MWMFKDEWLIAPLLIFVLLFIQNWYYAQQKLSLSWLKTCCVDYIIFNFCWCTSQLVCVQLFTRVHPFASSKQVCVSSTRFWVELSHRQSNFLTDYCGSLPWVIFPPWCRDRVCACVPAFPGSLVSFRGERSGWTGFCLSVNQIGFPPALKFTNDIVPQGILSTSELPGPFLFLFFSIYLLGHIYTFSTFKGWLCFAPHV